MGAFLYGNEMAVFFCKKVDLSPQHETKLMLDLFFILHFTYLGRVYGPPPAYRPVYGMSVISNVSNLTR